MSTADQCANMYINEGKVNSTAEQSAPYGGGSIQYFELLARWRESGNFEGLAFDTAP